MPFNPNELRSALQFGGARPNLFRVTLNNNFDSGLSSITPFMIQAASIPASVIAPISVPYFGRDIKVAGDRQPFEEWTVSVINDEDFRIRHSLETWQNFINSLSLNRNLTGGPQPSRYKTDGFLEQFSKIGGSAIRRYKFQGLWPVAIGAIELSWESRNQIQVFSTQFAFDWFEVDAGNTGRVA